MTTAYRGKRIEKDEARYRVLGCRPWGDQPGEDRYSFRTLRAAKAFIDRMEAEAATA